MISLWSKPLLYGSLFLMLRTLEWNIEVVVATSLFVPTRWVYICNKTIKLEHWTYDHFSGEITFLLLFFERLYSIIWRKKHTLNWPFILNNNNAIKYNVSIDYDFGTVNDLRKN